MKLAELSVLSGLESNLQSLYNTCVELEGRHWCGGVSGTVICSQILMCVISRSIVGGYTGRSEVLAASCTQEVLRR